jgi:signal transduction histidine kinase
MLRGRLAVKLPLLVVVAVLLTAGAAAALAVYLTREALLRQAQAEVIDRREMYANAIEFYLMGAISMVAVNAERQPVVEFAARSVAVEGPRPSASETQLFRDLLAGPVLRNSKVFEYLMLLRPDGAVTLLEPRSLERKLSHRDMTFTAWYREVARTGRLVVSDLTISPATQQPAVVIAVPVRGPDHRVVGILAGEVQLDELSKIGAASTGRGEARPAGFLTDRRGLIIAHEVRPDYVENQTDFSSVPPVRAALAGGAGAGQYRNQLDGNEEIGAYRALADLGWVVVYSVPVRVALAPADLLTRLILVGAAALAIVVGLLAVLVAKRIAGPIARLTAAAESIGTGRFQGPLDVRTGDEIEVLATSFDRMSGALRESQGQLERRAEQLEEANRELEAFSYSVSHDLRAPLRAMDGFARILIEEEKDALSARGQRLLVRVRQNAGQMGQLVDDLLAFARLGRRPMRMVAVDSGSLVGQALGDLEEQRDGRSVEIVTATLHPCEGDPALLRQVWVNLVGNALKFTRGRDAARIEIGSQVTGRETVYHVKDNGVGFDMQYADKLFGVFQRLHRADEYEGTGVGLAIVQRIVHRHGGRVWAESKEGTGTTMYFAVPGGTGNGKHGG